MAYATSPISENLSPFPLLEQARKTYPCTFPDAVWQRILKHATQDPAHDKSFSTWNTVSKKFNRLCSSHVAKHARLSSLKMAKAAKASKQILRENAKQIELQPWHAKYKKTRINFKNEVKKPGSSSPSPQQKSAYKVYALLATFSGLFICGIIGTSLLKLSALTAVCLSGAFLSCSGIIFYTCMRTKNNPTSIGPTCVNGL